MYVLGGVGVGGEVDSTPGSQNLDDNLIFLPEWKNLSSEPFPI